MSNKVARVIQDLMEAKGYTATQFAALLGWSPSTLSKKFNGQSRISRHDREVIGAALGTDADTIDAMAGVPFAGPPGRKPPPPARNVRSARIPLINRAAAGAISQFHSDAEAANGYSDAMDTIPRGSVDDPDAFAVVVDGESMLPTLVNGDVLVLSPVVDEDPRLVDGVVVHVRTTPDSHGRGGNLIGRWFMDHERKLVVIRKDNPKFPPVELSAVAWQDIARVAIAVERRTRQI